MKYSFMESFFHQKAERWIPSANVNNEENINWHSFAVELEELSKVVYESKSTAPLISPAYYDGLVYRKNENVSGWSFLALDFDSGEQTFDKIKHNMTTSDLNFVMYSTASNKITHNKFRLFMELNRNVMPCHMDAVWYAAFILFDGTSDAQCKDKSRGYYVPGNYPGAYSQFAYHSTGRAADVDILMQTYPMPKPVVPTFKPFVKAGRTYSWSSIDNCPFVKAMWMNEYITRSGPGHYIALYKFMCRVAGKAKELGYAINEMELAALTQELDLRKDGRWAKQHRNWKPEARNAIKHVMGGA